MLKLRPTISEVTRMSHRVRGIKNIFFNFVPYGTHYSIKDSISRYESYSVFVDDDDSDYFFDL